METAHAQIRGTRILLDRIQARVGDIALEGDYRYEPQNPRPHRFRLAAAEADAAALERLFAPALQHGRGGLLARALGIGRTAVPEWLALRRMEGTVQIGTLKLAGMRLDKVRARVVWDALRVRADGISARVEDGALTGVLTASLRGPRPVYLFAGRLKAVSCRSGKMDTEGVLETRGMGSELLANLQSQGTFSGRDLELGSLPALESLAGAYNLVWAQPEPRLRFWDLQLAAQDDTYTGGGATQEDGRLLILLTSGSKEMRVRGTLARLQLDETAP